MGFFRWMIGMPLAAAITAGLFLMMAGLIKSEARLLPENATPQIDFLVKPPPPRINPPKPQPIDTDDIPPPPTYDREKQKKPSGDDYIPEPGPIDKTVVLPTRTGTTIQLAPQYPDACRSKGVEGVVIVEFDITDRGEATNVRILSSPDRCFDRDVIRAVRGWRFPAEARRGVTEAIKFQFEG